MSIQTTSSNKEQDVKKNAMIKKQKNPEDDDKKTKTIVKGRKSISEVPTTNMIHAVKAIKTLPISLAKIYDPFKQKFTSTKQMTFESNRSTLLSRLPFSWRTFL